MEIKPVKSSLELNEFFNLPYHIYKNNPMWVAPLRSEVRDSLMQQKSHIGSL